MDYVYNVFSNVKYFYTSMNPATLSGAIDVIVVEQPDGSYLSTPFHIRFGKYGVFNYDDKYVDIEINGEEIPLKMKLGENGVAFFVEETEDGERIPRYLATSPLPDEPNLMDDKSTPPLLPEKRPQPVVLPAIRRRHSTNGGQRAKNKRKQKRQRRRAGASSPGPTSFSDSELESRRLSAPEAHAETEWKWGEIPESSKANEVKKLKELEENSKKKNAYIWSWFGWSKRDEGQEGTSAVAAPSSPSTTLPVAAPTALTKPSTSEPSLEKPTISKTERKDDKGLYLEDIVDDPSRMAKYFGKRSGAASISSNVDSGNGVSLNPSLGTSPCSPSALSLNDEPIGSNGTLHETQDPKDDETTPTSEEIATAIQKDKAIEKELLAGTDENSSEPKTVEGVQVEMGDTPRDKAKEETPLPDPEVAAEKTDQIKRRYDSGNSAFSSASDFALSDEELASIELVAAEYKRSLRLSSDQLQSLRLQYGSNEARFSITTKFQGTAWCSCHIYLLRWDEKIVISDIDGTITKSDVLGHVIPAIGGTWAHTGVAELYTHIKANGYRIVYLSSRAIGLSYQTKNYLKGIKQGTKKLPDGPVLLSPTSVLMALRKEVIERKPYEFKIACLSDLKALFPSKQPFFAGFGNRPTDVKSYTAVGVPPERILIINPQGIVSRADRIGYSSDYASMANNIVDYIFPPIGFGRSAIKPTRFINYASPQTEDGSFLRGISPEASNRLVEEGLDAYNQRTQEFRKKSEERKLSISRK